MGIIGGLFSIVADAANESCKRRTGIDLKKEFQPIVNEYKELEKERKELEKHKSSYIDEYGDDAYNQIMQDNGEDIKYVAGDARDVVNDVYYNMVVNMNDLRFQKEYEKIESFGEEKASIVENELRNRIVSYENELGRMDNQSIRIKYKGRNALPAFKREVLNEEYIRRGLMYEDIL